MKLHLFSKNFVAILLLSTLLAGCAATYKSIAKRERVVETRFSDAVFLEPAPLAARKVWLEVRNQTGQPLFDIGPALQTALYQKSLIIVRDPAQADYILQTHIREVQRRSTQDIDQALQSGVGTGIFGAGVGYAIGGDSQGAIAGAVAGAAIATVAEAFVDDRYFTAIADIRLREKLANSDIAEKIHETRLITKANQVNLTLEEAAEVMQPAMIDALSELF